MRGGRWRDCERINKAVFVLFLGLIFSAHAQDPAAAGFDHFYNLEFDAAIAAFEEVISRRPNDPGGHNHLAQAILYREMHRSGALESELVTGANPFLRREKLKPSVEDQQRFEKAIAQAMDLSQSRLAKLPDDIESMYALGVSHGLRANYNFLVRKAWMDALRDITASRKLHGRIVRLKPEMIDARLVEGVHDYVVGSLPFTYKMLGFIIGFRGDKDGGIRTLELVAGKGDRNRTDAKVLLAVVYRRERRPGDAVKLLTGLLAQYPRNYLLRLEMVQMYGDLGNKEKALETLAELDRLKRAASPGFAALPQEKIHFARGTLLFWYRDYDVAIEELSKATSKAKDLDLNTGSMAWLRLGQCYDMKKRRPDALAAYRAAIEVAPDSDAARQSRQYLSNPYRRGKT